jgi:FKBP-type peptidyl-prolyl cis-trans isomerase FkpA
MKKTTTVVASMILALSLSACAAESTTPTADTKEVKTPSGIVITTLIGGSGSSPKSTDRVKVHYRGTLTDGKEFDSSYKRGEPAVFPLNRVIPCWTEAVQTMKVGGKAKLLCPSNSAYGPRGVPGTIPPNASLVFEVELLEILK